MCFLLLPFLYLLDFFFLEKTLGKERKIPNRELLLFIVCFHFEAMWGVFFGGVVGGGWGEKRH